MALQILRLNPNATRKEAKKAFRSLAKIWHPDRFAADSEEGKMAEARMKKINGAFYFIVPLLPVDCESVETQEGKTAKTPGFFSSVREEWNNWNKPTPGSGPVASKHSSPRPKRPVSKKSDGRRTASPRFEILLNSLEPNLKSSPGKTNKPVKPFDNYCRYMAVKKKTKGARNRSANMGIGRVEKISPIQRVNPIGEK